MGLIDIIKPLSPCH